MKFHFKLKVIGLAVVLMGLAGFAFADQENSHRQSPRFMDHLGGMMSFDYSNTGDDQSSSGTCVTSSPNGNMNQSESLLDNAINEPEPEALSASFTATAQSLLRGRFPGSGNQPGSGNRPHPPFGGGGPWLPPNFPGGENPPPNSTTPEPATLLIWGISLVGFVPLVRRYRRKQTIH